ncbi:MAG: hypothetical protein R3E39_26140 [Anaerolineae bacterium]
MMQPNPMLILSNALGFSAADLYANRIGLLTSHQRNNIIKHRKQAFENWFMGTLLVLLCVIFLHLQLMVAVFGLACMISLLLGIWMRYEEDLHSQVEAISGQIEVQPQIMLLGRQYRVDINGQIFRVSGRAKVAFNHQAAYRLYYTAGTHIVLAAELLG